MPPADIGEGLKDQDSALKSIEPKITPNQHVS
jgi:hypothetical protein